MRTIRRLAAAVLLLSITQAAYAQQAAPPGQFDYYLLTLSWSPAFCATHHGPATRAECGQHRGFIVHGLWPQNENGSWPAFCRDVQSVSRERITKELPLMPNAEMIAHEWEKHGSCTTDSADAYFDHLNTVFAGLHIPDALDRPRKPVSMKPAEVRHLFAAANPGLEPDAVSLRCSPHGDVEELRICLDTGFHPRACGKGQADACPVTARFSPIPDSNR